VPATTAALAAGMPGGRRRGFVRVLRTRQVPAQRSLRVRGSLAGGGLPSLWLSWELLWAWSVRERRMRVRERLGGARMPTRRKMSKLLQLAGHMPCGRGGSGVRLPTWVGRLRLQ
jgi:hypothetical protein